MPLDKTGMRILVTGTLGFVGPHLAQSLRRICGSGVTLIATSKEAGHHPMLGSVATLDVTNRASVEAALIRFAPTHVVHLAGIASPATASAHPEEAWRVHVQGALNVAQAILDRASDCWLIHVGSGLVYGKRAKPGLPLDENAPLAPADAYSMTKAAADLMLGALGRQGLKCIRMRPFNHTGPGQSAAFVVPAFAMQIAEIEAGLAPPVIHVGNLEAERDFLDVRDVADAYALTVRSCDDLEPSTIFNVASGIPRRIADVLERLLARSRVHIAVEQDPERSRPSDLPRVVGDASRIRKHLGWTPKHAFEDTLSAVLNDCRARLVRAE